MLIPILVVLVGVLMMWAEAKKPGRDWPDVKGWWARALAFNAVQAGAVYLAGILWDGWMQDHRLWSVEALGTVGGAVVGYVVLTFIYYWWHRARHEVPFLWRWFHQLHHSPQRLEVITSFYKHPFEILANALISSIVMYLVVGLSPEAAAGATLLAGLAELFYHWNVKTPHWVGYFIQRPESHCVHHEEGIHHSNYGDLPLWDMLFGTFHNPREFESRCGFGDDELRVGEMLAGHDVNVSQTVEYRGRLAMLAVIGLLGIAGTILGSSKVKGVAAATAASPAPKVFTSHKGLETFSTRFTLAWTDDFGRHEMPLTYDNYGRLQGPYNRRNVYGAVLAYGPVLATSEATIPMMRTVSRYALCPENGAPVLVELGIDPDSVRDVAVVYEPLEGTPEELPRILKPACDGGEA